MLDLLCNIIEFIVKIILLYTFFSIINIRKEIIQIDNEINETSYQNNKDFSHYETNYKILAIYYPRKHNYKINIPNGNQNEFEIQKNEVINESFIKQQVHLAKSHGIFGFGIVYNIINDKMINEKILNLFLNHFMNDFPFFIIFDYNLTYNKQNPNSLIENFTYLQNTLIELIESIQKYLSSDNYIKIRKKPLLGFFHSSLTAQIISCFRKFENKNKFDKTYILSISYNSQKIEYLNITNSFVEFPSQYIGLENNLNQRYFYNFYYPNLIEEEKKKSKKFRSFFIVNGSHPDKFFIIFRKFLNLTKSKKNFFILFNSWNNFETNSFLEPDEKFGFAYLNSLSKAIFNLNIEEIYNLEKSTIKSKIAVQVHLFYDDLINDIIIKTNNIPVNFDLYITITSPDLQSLLEKLIKGFSKTKHFEILIVENKGRDILPFLNQIKTKFRYYKYICHLHTKKSLTAPEIGILWRNYLYDNLLGSVNFVSEILHELESNKNLGFLFPEAFYKIIPQFYLLTIGTKKWMNFLASKLFSKYKIGDLTNFPAGNMFWARIEAIFQIFLYDFSEYFPNENEQTNDTILHAIERIWLYLVK